MWYIVYSSLPLTAFLLQCFLTRGESGEDALFQPLRGSSNQSQLYSIHSWVISSCPVFILCVFLAILLFPKVHPCITSILQESRKACEWSGQRNPTLHHTPVIDWQAAEPITVVSLGQAAHHISILTGKKTCYISFSVLSGQETCCVTVSDRAKASERSKEQQSQESFRLED